MSYISRSGGTTVNNSVRLGQDCSAFTTTSTSTTPIPFCNESNKKSKNYVDESCNNDWRHKKLPPGGATALASSKASSKASRFEDDMYNEPHAAAAAAAAASSYISNDYYNTHSNNRKDWTDYDDRSPNGSWSHKDSTSYSYYNSNEYRRGNNQPYDMDVNHRYHHDHHYHQPKSTRHCHDNIDDVYFSKTSNSYVIDQYDEEDQKIPYDVNRASFTDATRTVNISNSSNHYRPEYKNYHKKKEPGNVDDRFNTRKYYSNDDSNTNHNIGFGELPDKKNGSSRGASPLNKKKSPPLLSRTSNCVPTLKDEGEPTTTRSCSGTSKATNYMNRSWDDEVRLLNGQVHNNDQRKLYPPTSTAATKVTTKITKSRPMIMVEIEPGYTEQLRGARETYDAVRNDQYVPTSCLGCRNTIFCISDATYVCCPYSYCHTIGPNLGRISGIGGVGLGFTFNDLTIWQAEILRETITEAKAAAAAAKKKREVRKQPTATATKPSSSSSSSSRSIKVQ